MMHPKKGGVVCAFAFASIAGTLLSAPSHSAGPPQKSTHAAADLPTVEAILNRFVAVTGGKAAYEKINSTDSKATLTATMGGGAVKGTEEIRRKAPDKWYRLQTYSYSVKNTPFAGKTEQVYDGASIWETSTENGRPPELRTYGSDALSGKEIEPVFNSPLRWREAYSKIEMLGRENVNTKPAYVIRITDKTSKEVSVDYYDAHTGLKVKNERTDALPQKGTVLLETFYSDYRTVQGVAVPFKKRTMVLLIEGKGWVPSAKRRTVNGLGKQEMIVTITDYKVNVPLDDALFAVPPAPPPAEPGGSQTPPARTAP